MKKSLYLIAAISIFMASCTKQEDILTPETDLTKGPESAVAAMYITPIDGKETVVASQAQFTFDCIVTLDDGNTISYSEKQEYFTWDYEKTEGITSQGPSLYEVDGTPGEYTVTCTYDDGNNNRKQTQITIQVVEEYFQVISTNLIQESVNVNGYDTYKFEVTVKSDFRTVVLDVYDQSVSFYNLYLTPIYDAVENGLWTGSSNVVPTGTQIRGEITY